MARAFCTFGVAVLLCAFILQLLVSISLPFLTAFDIVRSSFDSGTVTVAQNRDPVSQLRLGLWAHCEVDAHTSDTTCDHTGHGYAVDIQGPKDSQTTTVRASWTNGLAVHPVAAAVTFVALLLSFSTHLTVTLIASLVSFLAALLTLIAFAIDIALFALTKHALDDIAHTVPGPGFWITLASFILLLLAGCTVCFGRHRDRRAKATPAMATTTYGSEKRPFWRRWRRTGY